MRRALRIAGVGTSLALLVSAPAALSAAPAADGPSILGGEPVPIGQWPTVVGVVASLGPGQSFFCTGSLIAPEWVLTAGHCVDATDLDSQQQLTNATQVVFDSNDLWRVTGTRVRAAATIPSPHFDISTIARYDVGLIRLATPVTDRAPIRLNRRVAEAPPGIAVTMVGFGRSTPTVSGLLYSLAGKPSIACTTMNLSDAFLLCCDRRNGTGQCFGDSGGPTLTMIDGVQKQVGIASFGDGSTCLGYAAQTRVDVVYDWIADQLGGEWRCASDGECDPRCGGFGNPRDADCAPCTADTECGFHRVCQANQLCGPAPLLPGGLGAGCSSQAGCSSSSCVTRGADSLCSQVCTPGGAGCPAGFDCLPDDGGLCWPTPPDSGGCTTAGASRGLTVLLVAAILGLGLRPRRRR